MTQTTMFNRLPLILAIMGAFLLSATGVYLFRDKGGAAEASAQDASGDAAKAAAAAGMNADDRKATEAIVRAYILEHPEILQEAAAVLQRRETSSNLASAGDQLHTPFAGAQAGNPAGDVTVVEFSDYNCGFCRSSVADVARLVGEDKGIKLIYREVPILAPSSKDAALWALAAAKQGKHAAFHSAMFSGGRPDATTIRAAAIRAGMDLATAENFIKTKEAVGELQNNVAMMRQIGFSGTPTFIIGDQIIEGALGHDALKAAVAKARKNKV